MLLLKPNTIPLNLIRIFPFEAIGMKVVMLNLAQCSTLIPTDIARQCNLM